jgi:hypothetical protein
MPTPKLYRRQAEDCVELANEATELYVKTALLERQSSASRPKDWSTAGKIKRAILHLDFR